MHNVNSICCVYKQKKAAVKNFIQAGVWTVFFIISIAINHSFFAFLNIIVILLALILGIIQMNKVLIKIVNRKFIVVKGKMMVLARKMMVVDRKLVIFTRKMIVFTSFE
jgi:hypothetical protein